MNTQEFISVFIGDLIPHIFERLLNGTFPEGKIESSLLQHDTRQIPSNAMLSTCEYINACKVVSF